MFHSNYSWRGHHDKLMQPTNSIKDLFYVSDIKMLSKYVKDAVADMLISWSFI